MHYTTCYYTLLEDILLHVDWDLLVTFPMKDFVSAPRTLKKNGAALNTLIMEMITGDLI